MSKSEQAVEDVLLTLGLIARTLLFGWIYLLRTDNWRKVQEMRQRKLILSYQATLLATAGLIALLTAIGKRDPSGTGTRTLSGQLKMLTTPDNWLLVFIIVLAAFQISFRLARLVLRYRQRYLVVEPSQLLALGLGVSTTYSAALVIAYASAHALLTSIRLTLPAVRSSSRPFYRSHCWHWSAGSSEPRLLPPAATAVGTSVSTVTSSVPRPSPALGSLSSRGSLKCSN